MKSKGLKETEHGIQNAVLDYLSYAGHYVWRNNTGVFKSEYTYKTGVRKGMTKHRVIRASVKGSSDILGCAKDGKLIAIEVKGPDGVVSPAQEIFLQVCRDRGAYAGVARSIEDAKAIMNDTTY